MHWTPFTVFMMVLLAFLCGSLPFSVWLGRLFLGKDVRQVGDGNPGATNVFRMGSSGVGVLALMLDVSKAAAPVGLAYFNLGLRGVPMLLVALAPMVGHAFSPFLHFRGGKALATALGVWIGLTVWKVSSVALVSVLVGIAFLTPAGWAVLLALAMILLTLLLRMPDPLLLSVWAGQAMLLTWTHRGDLRRLPRVRSWLTDRLSRPRGRDSNG